MSSPKVQTAIALGMKARIEAAGVDSIEVIQMLRSNYYAATESANHTAANRAAELLGQAIGLLGTNNQKGITREGTSTDRVSFDTKTKEILGTMMGYPDTKGETPGVPLADPRAQRVPLSDDEREEDSRLQTLLAILTNSLETPKRETPNE